MGIRSSLEAYFQIRPGRLQDAWRLYAAYAAALLMKLAAPQRFRAVGPLIPGRKWLLVSFGGVVAFVRPRTNDLDLLAPSFEPRTTAWFRVEPGDVVVDVGAHIGKYTLPAAKVASRVIAIEPDPSNFSVLRANILLNRLTNVSALNNAISSSPGKRRLFLAGEDNTGTSTLEPDWAPSRGHRPQAWVEVECLTMDHVIDSLDIESIDWLKVDVEHHEVAALGGARSALRRTKHLILEVTGDSEDDCRRLLKEAGLELVAIERGSPTSNWFLGRGEGRPYSNSGKPL